MKNKVKLYAVYGWGTDLKLVEATAVEQPSRYRLDEYTLPLGRFVPKDQACLSPAAAVNEFVAAAIGTAEELRREAKEFDDKAKAARALLKVSP